MLLGIDYPYWSTFNLRSVFPKLEDALKVFPSSTLYNQILLDWPILRDQVGKGFFTKPDLMRKIETLYGAYLLALSKGATPYKLSDRNPKFKTAAFMVEQTGIDRAVVVAFLTTLEKLAKSGSIDNKYWDPDRAVQRNKAVTQRTKELEASSPKGPLDKIQSTAEWIGFGALGILGVVALVYIKPFIPKPKG